MLIEVQKIFLFLIASSTTNHKTNINKSTTNMKPNKKYIENMFINDPHTFTLEAL